ncbi:Dwarfin sma-2 [Nymphon striatum]|nr:Dwarfin sma-2 [Nymphon striatum]
MDHIKEVLDKWHQIDDEIWAKIICMERNRRVAKAYARAPVLTIGGSDDGFDGFRIGLCGFENPLRDAKTEEVRKHIGNGVKIKMDDNGNILIKKVTKSNIFIKGISTPDNSIANDICKQKGVLVMDRPVKLFDFKKFQNNVNKELKQAYPDRRKLESQCISTICFVRNEMELLDCPCWVMIINVVALDMLKSKLPPVSKKHSVPSMKIMNGNSGRSGPLSQTRLPTIGHEEDPYSIAGSGGSGSSSSQDSYKNSSSRSGSGELKPPKLPPRDSPSNRPSSNSKRDNDNENVNRNFSQHHLSSRKKMPHVHDDPYYCGMSARVPNFAKKIVGSNYPMKKSHSSNYLERNSQERGFYPDSGLDSDLTGSSDDAYSALYGKMKTQGFPLRSPREAFVGEWE